MSQKSIAILIFIGAVIFVLVAWDSWSRPGFPDGIKMIPTPKGGIIDRKY